MMPAGLTGSKLAGVGLTLGPLLFHWPVEKRRDFYARIADEAPVDCVHLGEVICSKRAPFFEREIPAIAERLKKAGKQVVLSTLALVTTEREIAEVRAACDAGYLVEVNDVSCLRVLGGRPHVVGPLMNVFNEGALSYMVRGGAVRVVPPPEVSAAGIATLARAAQGMDKGAMDKSVEIEAFAFGRQVLSIAMRCYHARSRGLTKDTCQFACEADPDGLPLATIADEPFGVVNGISVLSHGYVAAFAQMAPLAAAGVARFRLSPQDCDMVAVAKLARSVLDGAREPASALAELRPLIGAVPVVDGYLRGVSGRETIPA